MKKAIEIEELRVSSDSKNIEFIINCPNDYHFSTFDITVISNNSEFSIAESLFYDEDGEYITSTDNRFIGQIPVSLFNVTKPEIYHIYLEADYIPTDDELPEDSLEASAYISDVNKVYDCMISDILANSTGCSDKEVQDRVIKNYLLLYAHQEALHLKRIDEAVKWFKLLNNCFTQCENKDRTTSCGSSVFPTVTNCGCAL